MEKDYPQKSERYMEYRAQLFSKGFSEAKQKAGHFFRQATEKTAFVVNFEEDDENYISVLYGFTSTACLAGNEEWFVNHGAYIDDCQVRNILYVWDDDSEFDAKKRISDFYEQYKNHSKDEILYVKKEKQQITIDIDCDVIDYFKVQSSTSGIPYQTLINLYLSDCVTKKRELQMTWE